MRECVLASLSFPHSLFLSLPSDLSLLHQVQLISAVPLSSASLLKKAGISPRVTSSWAGTGWSLTPGGELITGNDAPNFLHHVYPPACISVLCKSYVLKHIHIHCLFSLSSTLEKLILTLESFS